MEGISAQPNVTLAQVSAALIRLHLCRWIKVLGSISELSKHNRVARSCICYGAHSFSEDRCVFIIRGAFAAIMLSLLTTIIAPRNIMSASIFVSTHKTNVPWADIHSHAYALLTFIIGFFPSHKFKCVRKVCWWAHNWVGEANELCCPELDE